MKVRARAFRLELRVLNDGPPLIWAVATVVAFAFLLCAVVGSVLSLRAPYLAVSENLIGVAFLGSILVFATVMLGGAFRYVDATFSRFTRIIANEGRLPRSLPSAVTGTVILSFVVTAIICVSSLDRMGAGAAEEVNGRYFVIDHGDRTEVSRSDYTAARAAKTRFMAVVASAFLGLSAVAAQNRRNALKYGFDGDAASDTPDE